MPDDIITDAFKSMFPELKRHLDMTTLRHWSKKIANAKNINEKAFRDLSFDLRPPSLIFS